MEDGKGRDEFGGGYRGFVNRFSATPAGSWLVKHFAAHVDPWVFKVSNGRFTATGPPTLPMLTLTTVGRKTGKPRPVQLAYHERGDTRFVVASAMGQDHHPAWSHNLDANPEVEVRVRGEVYPAHARRIGREEKADLWPAIARTIPQMHTYEARTDRDIKVYALTRR